MKWNFTLVFLLAWNVAWAGERFQTMEYSMDIPESGRVSGLAVLTESNRFTFIPPSSQRIRVDEEHRTVTLEPRTGVIFIAFTIKTNQFAPESDESLQRETVAKFRHGVFLQDSACYTGSGRGPGMDIQWEGANDRRLITRVIYLSFRGGTVEFSLTGPPDEFAASQRLFSNFLNSFRVEPWLEKQ